MAPERTEPASSRRRPVRLRRRRRLGVVLLLLALIVVLIPVVLTRTPVVKAIIVPRIERELGADVSIDRLVVEPDARVVASGVRIRLRGVDGPAGDLLQADRVELVTTWGELLSGSGRFEDMLLIRPRLRVSRDVGTGEINLSRLRTPDGMGGSAPPPRVIVREGTVELGEQTETGWDLLRTLRVEGAAVPELTDAGGEYELSFTEGSVSDTEGRGLGLTGRVSDSGVEFLLEGLEFGRWRPEHIPSEFREVFGLMRIEGAVPSASMRVGSGGKALGVVRLDGVALNLPFDIEGRAADPESLVRLRGVTGEVRVSDSGAVAELDGLLGDLPASVWLRYDGLSANSGFECKIDITGYQLTSDPEVLPLAPGIVVRRLNDFSNPTATIDASVELSRAAPAGGVAAGISLRGELRFRDGSATFQEFPYPFANLNGLARFDEEKIEIVGIDGVAATGARLHAEGQIAPPLPGAAVDLRVTVEDAPIDDALLSALGEQRREIVEALCSSERFDRLNDKGLLDGTGFMLGGNAAVDLHIVRPFGEETDYSETVTVRLAEVGLVPEPFPLPIVARDVVIEIAGREALVTSGSFAGVSGGRAEIDARVDLTKPDEGGIELTIGATGVPLDDLLLAALPGGLDETPSERSPSEVLRRLGAEGDIDCTAEIAARDDGELGYDISVALDGLRASPVHEEGVGSGPVTLRDAAGELFVSEDLLRLVVDSAAVEGAGAEGRVGLDATLGLAEGARPFEARVSAEIGDVSLAVEDLVGVVAPTLAERLTELRRTRRPTGAVSLHAIAAGDAAGDGEVTRLDVEVGRCESFAFDQDLGRMTITAAGGTVAFSALLTESAVFDEWDATLWLDGEPAGRATLDGKAPIGRAWASGDLLGLDLREARLESRLVRRSAETALPPGLIESFREADLVGEFDAELSVRGDDRSASPAVTGLLRPRSCELTVASERVSVESMAGGIVLGDGGGSFEEFRAAGDGWTLSVAGDWAAAGSDGAILAECVLSARSDHGLTPDVSALLPGPVRRALEALSFEIAGPVSAESVKLRLTLDNGVSHAASGRVVFTDASADVGVRVTGASGYLDFEAESVPGRELASFGIGAVLDRARAAEIVLSDAMVRVTSDPVSGTVLVPVMVADVYGGRLTGSGVIRPGGVGPGAQAPGSYDAEFRLSGVPLGELLADWEHAADVEQAAESESDAPVRADAESRGMIDAGVTLTGALGDPASRRGRGTVYAGGEGTPVLRLPLLLPLIEVSNLQVPGNETLDFAEAVFYLDGERVVFERVGVFASSVEIFGYGQMLLPGLELDLRFRSRAVARLPLLSDMLERFRDELITTRVRGTARDPSVQLEQFTGTRRLFSGAVGREMSEDERRMLEIERLSRESARREWRVPRRAGSGTSPGG